MKEMEERGMEEIFQMLEEENKVFSKLIGYGFI